MNHNTTTAACHIAHWVLLSFSLLFAACTKNEPATLPQSEYEVGFRTEGIASTTRTASPFVDGSAFGVLAYTCPTGTFDPFNSLPNLLYNARVEKYTSEGDVGYRYIPTAHWPSGTNTKVQFAAYSPHSSAVAGGAIIISPFTSPGLPKIQVVMGIEKGSVDFATSTVGPISRVYTSGGDPSGTPTRSTNYVNFLFKRQMAYVSFRCKAVNSKPNTKLYINLVTLRNIYRRGTFNMGAAAGNEWEDRGIDATTGATLNLSSIGAPVSETEFKDLADPTNSKGVMFSVIPQTYDNVELSVVYTLEYLLPSGGSEHRIVGTKTVPLTVVWTAGKQHIYDLEFSFNEAYGENALLHFEVQPWQTVDVPTTMD